MGFCAFFEQNDRLTFYKLKIGQDDNPAGTRRNGSHPLPSIARPPDLVVRLVTEGGRYIAFPPPISIQLFPTDFQHDRVLRYIGAKCLWQAPAGRIRRYAFPHATFANLEGAMRCRVFSYNKIQYRANCHGWFRAAIQSRFWNAEARPTRIRMTLQPLVNPVRHLMLSLTIEAEG